MYADHSTNVLRDSILRLSVRLEGDMVLGDNNRGLVSNDRTGFTRLGSVNVNLARFATVREATRRFLLEESSINATLTLTLRLKQIKGDPMFRVPREGAEVADTNTKDVPTPQAVTRGSDRKAGTFQGGVLSAALPARNQCALPENVQVHAHKVVEKERVLVSAKMRARETERPRRKGQQARPSPSGKGRRVFDVVDQLLDG